MKSSYGCLLMLVVAIVHWTNAEKSGKLIYASVLFRHGDRAPVSTYPTDPYANPAYWNDNWGQLTNLGKREHYVLGQFLKQRYSSILSADYNENEMAVESTDYDRTIESALTNLAGMYPPYGKSLWDPYIDWQPIAVRSTPNKYDYLMGEPIPECPAYADAYAALENTKQYKDLIAESQPLFKYLTTKTGQNVTTLRDALGIRDNLFVNNIYHEIPLWAQSIFADGQLDKLVRYWFTMAASTTKLARIRSGFLFKTMLDRSSNKTTGTLVPSRSVHVYSAHDTTIANLLNLLGLYDVNSSPPPYASTVLIEVRSVANQSYVEVYYKNSTAVPTAQFIPKCGYSCPLAQMYQLYHDVLPSDNFDLECKKSFFSKIESAFHKWF